MVGKQLEETEVKKDIRIMVHNSLNFLNFLHSAARLPRKPMVCWSTLPGCRIQRQHIYM